MWTGLEMKRQNFWRNSSGNVGVIFAISALPIMIGSSLAMDNYQATSVRADLQAAVDNAVLATVSNGSLDPGDRQSYAEARFNSNYTQYAATTTFSDNREIVTMTATAKMPTMMGSIIGKNDYKITATAAGTVNRGRTICVLALSENQKEAVKFSDSVYFQANNCSVHVNSSHANAIVNTSTMTPEAQDFCVKGGGRGKFDPPLNSQCDSIQNPYKDIVLPVPTTCVEDGAQRTTELVFEGLSFLQTGTYGGTNRGTTVTVGDGETLTPGTYCDPLTIDGANITFEPGVYQFLYGVTFKNSAQVHADDVTLVLHGRSTTVDVETGAQVYLKAPAKGDLAGLTIVQGSQDYLAIMNTVFPDTAGFEQAFAPGDATSRLQSGGHLDVIGTVYLPDQHLDVSGTSSFGARARSTSFIANSVHFSERTRTNLAVNHQAEGLPPIEPRVEEAPRLIR